MRKIQWSILGSLIAATLFVPAPSYAKKQVEAPAFQTVKPGDREMSCEALAAEINSLDGQRQADASAKQKKKKGLGFLKMLGAASPILGVAGSGGAVASTAMGAAGSVAGGMGGSGQEDAEAMLQRNQRKQRLMGIFDEKKC
ncbi:hypothetical protein [Sphingopyxis terrae]|nr:hypothetical protein [Sphingopyxis terrae]